MKDDDSLYFSFDDQEEPEEEERAQAEEGQNKTFLYGIIALAAIFVLTLCLGIGYVVWGKNLLGGGTAQVSPNELTNQVNIATYNAAQAQTQNAPTPTSAEVISPTLQTSPTPTSGVAVTVIGTETVVGTEIAEITAGPGTEAVGTPGAGTAVGTPGTQAATTPGTGTQAAQATSGLATATKAVSGLVTPTSIKPTSSIIEVTPLGGGATPTRLVSGVGGTATGGAATAKATGGVGGPFQPTVQPTLPTTGFAGGAGLLGAGFLAIALVAVVVIVRRMRLQ
jgi:hypothetical protein